MGKSSPPREPDYTKERAGFAESAYQDRLRQSENYNRQVSDYNSQLNDYLGQYNNLSNQIGGLTIRDADQFSAFSSQLGDLQRQVTGSSFTTSQPFFESMVQSPYGAVQVGVPSLSQVNTRAQNTISSGLEGLAGQLNSLKQQRSAEEARIRDFRSGLISQLGGVSSSLGNASIANKSLLDSLSSQLDAIDLSRNTFSSSILDQLYPAGFTQVGSQYDLARSALDDLYSRRAAEEQRINAYQTGLQSAHDNFNSLLGGLTIADEAGLNSLKQAIDQRQLEASRFRSELGYDFSTDLGQIQGIEDRLDRLIQDRQSELGRIESAQRNAMTAANTLDEQLGLANIYDLYRLDSIGRAINQGRNEITNFNSLLPYDFSDITGRLDAADQTLASLRGQRDQRLGGYQSELDALLSSIQGSELYEEQNFRDAIAAAQGLQSQVSRFSGSDVLDLGFGIEDALRSANTRLGELGEYRSGIETRAQAALEAARSGSYYDASDFTAHQSALDALMEEMNLYNATQASDELSSLTSFLDKERSRLAQDLVNSSSASAIEQSDVARMLQQMQGGGTPMTAEQYMFLLSQLEEEERNPANDNLFSRNLGVIRL